MNDALRVEGRLFKRGRSAVIADLPRKGVEGPISDSTIVEYAAPIEFIYDGVRGPQEPGRSGGSRG